MKDRPKRKHIRLEGYDYASDGVYFITICAKTRTFIFWEDIDADSIRQLTSIPLSAIGKLVDSEIQKIESYYLGVYIEKYCIMPDHIHMLIRLSNYELTSFPKAGEHSSPLQGTDVQMKETHNPSISRIIKQFKGAITKKLGRSIWQKSFIDRVIRSEHGFMAVWEYIHYNPLNLDFSYDNIDFDMF